MTLKGLPTELTMVHCGRDCKECPLWEHVPNYYCEIDKSIMYRIEGTCVPGRDCASSDKCCGSCGLLKDNMCTIYKDRRHGCREYPTVHTFLEDNIPPKCSYTLVEVKT